MTFSTTFCSKIRKRKKEKGTWEVQKPANASSLSSYDHHMNKHVNWKPERIEGETENEKQ